MAIVKVFPRGAQLYKEGDKITSLYLVESGNVSVGFHRGKAFIELYSASKSALLGDGAIFGTMNHRATAMATSEVKVVEVPVTTITEIFEQQPAVFKVVMRGVGDRLKLAMHEIRNSKLEGDATPCPTAHVPKAFGAIFHTARHTGTAQKFDGMDTTRVDWRSFKAYLSRIFFEDTRRVESIVNILVKLELAKLEYGKNEDDPKAVEELMSVHFLDLSTVEQFFEFYQHYLNKSGKQDLLKVDDTNYFILEAMMEVSLGEPLDRSGSVVIDFNKLADLLKNECGINLNTNHFGNLELKGLFFKRAAAPNGSAYVAFNYQEIKTTFQNWKFILEIDRWNEAGSVNVKVPALVRKKPTASTGHSCPTCKGEVEAVQKFCGNCGSKLSAAEAA